MSARANALVKHYHETYELTYKARKDRNYFFLLLLTTLAIAALITYSPKLDDAPAAAQKSESTISGSQQVVTRKDGRNSFFLTVLCYVVLKDGKSTDCVPGSNGQPETQLDKFTKVFPHDVFNVLVSAIVFYLMLNITNLTSTISRYYHYLSRLEQEVRRELSVGRSDVAFAREGKFYKSHGTPMQRVIRWSYVILIGIYFYLRIASELQLDGHAFWVTVHATIAFLTALVLFGYMKINVGWFKFKDPTAGYVE